MTEGGTSMYAAVPFGDDVPPLVRRAVAQAERLGFPLCVHPATGRLLHALAGGVPAGGRIGESGTGAGADGDARGRARTEVQVAPDCCVLLARRR